VYISSQNSARYIRQGKEQRGEVIERSREDIMESKYTYNASAREQKAGVSRATAN
jgi:hypothetical protein